MSVQEDWRFSYGKGNVLDHSYIQNHLQSIIYSIKKVTFIVSSLTGLLQDLINRVKDTSIIKTSNNTSYFEIF